MSSEPFILPSFAKINLVLRVIGKRADGFHELYTVFQSVSLADSLSFSLADEGIELTSTGFATPAGEANIVMRAAAALKERFGVSHGTRIHLNKRIPSPGGLGGGSSNAATALVGLSRLWGLPASINELRPIARELGSDVPFFLYGGTAMGTGRGSEIEQMRDVEPLNLIIVTPPEVVNTADAFAALNARNLTKADSDHILNVCRFELGSFDLRSAGLRNDFETSIFAAYPEIRRVKETLSQLGAKNALLCGSGPSVFGIFEKEETRQAAMKALDNEVNWRKFAVATVSRDEYREALMMC